jgi:hypothetical protein
MESTFSLLRYFQRIRENFDNLDVIEEFGVNEALKYDPNDPDYLEKLRASYDETGGYYYDETQEQEEEQQEEPEEDTSATPENPAVTLPVTPPVTSPVTSPVTPPVTSPVTSPVTPPENPAITLPVTPPVTSPVTPPENSPVTPATPPVTPEELAPMNGGSPATPNSENTFQDQQNANIVPPASQTPPTSQTPPAPPTSQTPPTSNANSSNIETPTKLPSTIAPPVILPEDTPSNGLSQETIPGQCSSKDLFDFNCYKNLKILLWFLLILITIVIIAFFLYLVNKLVRVNNNTPTIKTAKSSSLRTVRLKKVDSSPEPKSFLSRLFGFKDDSKKR